VAETTRIISAALDSLGKHEEAERWLSALALRYPASHSARLWLSRARFEHGQVPRGEVDRVDQALLDDRVELASARALELGLSEAQLAAREVALGLPQKGFDRATTVFEADPSDATAWVVLLVSADLLGDEAGYGRIVAQRGDLTGPVDDLASLLFVDLLKRRVGEKAARAWLRKAGASDEKETPATREHGARPNPGDPLTSQVRARLSEEFTAPTNR
jgi:hypothetical protein